MLSYPDILDFLSFYPSELGSKGVSDHKNSKAYSYYKLGSLQNLQWHNLSGSQCCIRGECKKFQSIKGPFHKLWMILEKITKTRTSQRTCMADVGTHVTMLQLQCIVLKLQFESVWLILSAQAMPMSDCQWVNAKLKDLDFSRHGFGQRGTKKQTISSFTKKGFIHWKTDLKPLSIKYFVKLSTKFPLKECYILQ